MEQSCRTQKKLPHRYLFQNEDFKLGNMYSPAMPTLTLATTMNTQYIIMYI